MVLQYTKPLEIEHNLGVLDLDGHQSRPAHLLGAIQDQGAVLILDRRGPTVLAASTSVASFTGREAREIIGEPADWATGIDDFGAALRTAGIERSGGAHVKLDLTLPWVWEDHAVFAYILGRVYIIEFVPCSPIEEGQFRKYYNHAREIIHALPSSRTRAEASTLCAGALSHITGYDRIGVAIGGEIVCGSAHDGSDSLIKASGSRAVELILDHSGRISRILPTSFPETGLPYDLSGAYLCCGEQSQIDQMRASGIGSLLSYSLTASRGRVVCLASTPKRAEHERILLGQDVAAALDRRLAELRS